MNLVCANDGGLWGSVDGLGKLWGCAKGVVVLILRENLEADVVLLLGSSLNLLVELSIMVLPGTSGVVGIGGGGGLSWNANVLRGDSVDPALEILVEVDDHDALRKSGDILGVRGCCPLIRSSRGKNRGNGGRLDPEDMLLLDEEIDEVEELIELIEPKLVVMLDLLLLALFGGCLCW